MFGFPASTEFNKRIPKQKFYEHINIPPSIKRSFIEQIHLICWRNKLTTSTLNLEAGENVTEIEVLELRLNTPCINEATLYFIDQKIPYHILFILTHQNLAQSWIGYKEISSQHKKFSKVSRYFHTPWVLQENLNFHINGLNIDSVYENLVRFIASNKITSKQNEPLRTTIEREELKRKLQKRITQLESKLRSETQLNRLMLIKAELKVISAKLETVSYES